MILQRDWLEPGAQGSLVAVLHSQLYQLGFAIPVRELQRRLFGTATRQAVERFQEAHRLRVTGIVDDVTASAIGTAVEDLANDPARFSVRGRITNHDGRGLAGLIVRAADRDLKRTQRLGQSTTNEQGLYEVTYERGQLIAAEKRRVDLEVTVLNAAGQVMVVSDVWINAPAEAVVDLVAVPALAEKVSESEHLLKSVEELLDGTPVSELTAEDTRFIALEATLEPAAVAGLRQSAVLARETGVPLEAWFGLARAMPIDSLPHVFEHSMPDLRAAIEAAAQSGVVPRFAPGALDTVMRDLAEVAARTTVVREHHLFLRLLDVRSRQPLPRLQVRLAAAGAPERVELGDDVTNQDGVCALVYPAPVPVVFRGSAVHGAQALSVRVLTSDGQEIHRTELTVSGEAKTIDVLLPAPAAGRPPDPKLSELTDVSAPLVQHLQQRGITTLGQLRAAGGLRNMRGLPLPPSDPAIARLDGYAMLSVVTPDTRIAKAMIDSGLTDSNGVARSRTAAVRGTSAALGDYAALEGFVRATAVKRYLDNLVMEYRAGTANQFESSQDQPILVGSIGLDCSCSECKSALGPLAYLADLLQYALTHVRLDGDLLTLSALKSLFHQPFGSLPVSCAELKKKVLQVRLAIEVLRSYLKAHPPSPAKQAGLASKEEEYRFTVYSSLLESIGTSFIEIRLAGVASSQERLALAARLGVDLPASGPTPLETLYLDPEATPAALTEKRLEEIFGLVDTTRNPLAAGPTPLLQTWRLAHLRTQWQAEDWPPEPPLADTTPLDPDVITLGDLRHAVAGQPIFDIWEARRSFIDATLQDVRASRETEGLNATLEQTFGVPLPDFEAWRTAIEQGSDGSNVIAQIEQANLTVESFWRLMQILAKAANPLPPQQPTPAEWDEFDAILTQVEKRKRFETWRNEDAAAGLFVGGKQFWPPLESPHLRPWLASESRRRAWEELLRLRTSRPNIDPDLVGPADFAKPTAGPVFSVWNARRSFVDAALAQAEAAPQTPAGLGELLESTVGITLDEFDALVTATSAGAAIAPRLAQLDLDLASFLRLRDVRGLISTSSGALDSEWEDARFVCIESLKKRQFAEWREEERTAGLTISSDHFVERTLPADSPELPRFRSRFSDRVRLEARLQSRIAQEERVRDSLAEAVDSVERDTLPPLRDALVWASNNSGTLGGRADWVTANLLIDGAAAGCLHTNRVAQAIDTLQILLHGLRTAQLNDTHPTLELDADHFDVEWAVIGSFSSWRAAMALFFHPENLLGPTLRRHLTPAFEDLMEALRTGPLSGPEDACALASRYAATFRDVCELSIEATCQTLTRNRGEATCGGAAATGYSNQTHMFAIGADTRSLYWSTFDPGNETGYAQSFWHRIDGFENVVEIVGAVPYTIAADRRYIFLFALVQQGVARRLMLSRYDLEKLRWTNAPIELALPTRVDVTGVVATQWETEDQPPELIIHAAAGLYRRRMTADGTGWEPVPALPPDAEDTGAGLEWEGAHIPWIWPEVATLHAVVVNSSSLPYFFYTTTDGRLYSVFTSAFLYLPAEHDFGTAVPLGFAIANDKLHSFYKPSGGPETHESGPHIGPTLAGVGNVARSYGANPAGSKWVAFRRVSPHAGSFFSTLGPLGVESYTRRRAAPSVAAPLDIPLRLAEGKLQLRKGAVKQAFKRNEGSSRSTFTYLEEAYYFVPVQLALELQRQGLFVEALDAFRTVYDYSVAPANRKIYYGLVLDAQMPKTVTFDREEDWLLDSVNPHSIAAVRRHAVTRYTMIAIAQCMLEYADAEFARDTTESVNRARVLYHTVLDLLQTSPLKSTASSCADTIGTLDIPVGEPQWSGVIPVLQQKLSAIASSAALETAAAGISAALSGAGSLSEKFSQALGIAEDAVAAGNKVSNLEDWLSTSQAQLANVQAALVAAPEIADAALRMSERVAGDLKRSVSLVTGIRGQDLPESAMQWTREPSGFGTAIDVLDDVFADKWLDYPGLAKYNAVAPSHAQFLAQSAAQSPMSALDQVTGYQAGYLPAPTFGFCVPPNPLLTALRLRAELNLEKIRTCRNIAGLERELEPYADQSAPAPASVVARRPAAYRYSFLLGRAKEMGQVAAQMESTLLHALERKDSEDYTLLRARQDLELTLAGVSLEHTRREQAAEGVRLAQAQLARAQQNYDDVDLMKQKSDKAQPSGGNAADPYRYRQQLYNQHNLAWKELGIARVQMDVSARTVDVIGREIEIAELRARHADAGVEALANKFTNAELYDWMSVVIEGVYGFLMRRATALLRLAAQQLSFERQQPIGYAITDHFQALTRGAAGQDRRGLTGSALLLQDIHQIDLLAVETAAFKLRLSKTISLARLDPIAFEKFRHTGRFLFSTTLDNFDRDFPGHIVRLVRHIAVNCIALIPPVEGIRATLSTTGISHVVIGRDTFESVTINVGPQTLAVSHPRETSDRPPIESADMLQTFEGMGVAATFEFRMPKAANPIDFGTIADVQVTIEYDALDSFAYRAEVISRLHQEASIQQTRSFSFRHQFADQWYALHNPASSATPMSVRFRSREADFPHGVGSLRIEDVSLYFSIPEDSGASPALQANLRYEEEGGFLSVGGVAAAVDGLIGISAGNAPSWSGMIGRSPAGDWQLSLDDTEPVRRLFAEHRIADILLVIGYSGERPEWL